MELTNKITHNMELTNKITHNTELITVLDQQQHVNSYTKYVKIMCCDITRYELRYTYIPPPPPPPPQPQNMAS